MEPAPPELVRHTLEKLADDFDISAVRLGMLGSAAVAEAVADVLEDRNLPHVVLDPILRSSSGAALIDAEGLAVLRKRLLRLAEVVTPNIDEAAELADIGPLHPSTHWEEALAWMIRAADKLHSRGVRNVVITGGHLAQPNDLLSQKVGQRDDDDGLSGIEDPVPFDPWHWLRLCHRRRLPAGPGKRFS